MNEKYGFRAERGGKDHISRFWIKVCKTNNRSIFCKVIYFGKLYNAGASIKKCI